MCKPNCEPPPIQQGYAVVVQALTIDEKGDVEVLLDQDRLLTIMEEYVNAGIDEIQHNVLELPGMAIENLVNFLI